MRKLDVASKGAQLVISRRKAPYVLTMAGWTLAFAGFIAIPFMGAFVYHRNAPSFIIFLSLSLPILILYLYRGVSYLRPHTFVFDREHDFVTLNDKVVCSLKELKSIYVEKCFYGFRRTSGSSLRLSFLTQSGTDEEIEQSSLYGPSKREMERIAAVIAEYADVPLIKPEY